MWGLGSLGETKAVYWRAFNLGKVDLHPDVKIDEHVQVMLVDGSSSLYHTGC
jgi:hypothetical protein